MNSADKLLVHYVIGGIVKDHGEAFFGSCTSDFVQPSVAVVL